MISDTTSIDISDQTDSNSVCAIIGKWEFYWDTLMTPSQIKECNLHPTLVEVPGSWKKYGERTTRGVATYRTKLKVEPQKFYSLIFRRVYLAHKIWINGQPYEQSGNVTKDMSQFVPADVPKEYSFFAESDSVEIVIQIANKDYRNSGIGEKIRVGTFDAVEKYTFELLVYEVFVMGAMLFVFFFIFFIFALRKKVDYQNFYFSLFLFFQALASSLDGEIVMLKLIPDMSWLVVTKLWYISIWARSFFLFLFILKVTYLKNALTINKIARIFTLIVVFTIIVSPVKIFSRLLGAYHFFAYSVIIYSVYLTATSLKRDKYLYLTLFGLIFILLFGAHNILVDAGIIRGYNILEIGVLIFVLCQLFYITITNVNMLSSDEIMTRNIDIQSKMNLALLDTNSFDIENSLEAYVSISNVDKVLIFFHQNNKLYLTYQITRDLDFFRTKQEIDLEADSNLYCSYCLRKTYRNKQPISKNSKELKKIGFDYFKKNKLKNLFIIPIIDENEVVSIAYIEKRHISLSNTQLHIVNNSYNFLQNIVISTFLYTNLQEINSFLETEIEKSKNEIKHQNEEIDYKNKELNEKIQFIEEQIILQKEITESIAGQNLKLEVQKKELEDKNRELKNDKADIERIRKAVTKNIKYASTLLAVTKEEEKETPFEYYYFLNKPKGIVGGDFFWSKTVNDKFIFSLADSTGHGIPGALMSLLGTKLISKVIIERIREQKTLSAADILEGVRTKVKYNITDKNENVQDGYDMAFCVFDPNTQKLQYAGANNPLIIIRNNEIIQIAPNRMPVGAYIRELPFKNNIIQLQKGDMLYIFSDGYVDQYGEKTNSKFYLKNFKELLLKISDKNSEEQYKILEKTFNNWKGNKPQIDDVSVVGLKL